MTKLWSEVMNFIVFLCANDLLFYSVLEVLSYEFNYGFILELVFVTQIVSGVFLTCFFIADSELAFDSIVFIVRNIYGGWLLRYIHVNGSSLVFMLLYCHLIKGLSFMSFRFGRELVWLSGFMIFLLASLIGFTGYSLVWGQMSYWALTVITNLVTAVPIVGFDILFFLWANVVICTFTLRRFFVIHFLVPFIGLGLVFVHLLIIHRAVSKNFIDVYVIPADKVLFGPFIVKDVLVYIVVVGFWCLLCCSVFVKTFIHYDNFMKALVFVTPALIEPEWYFLPYYCILRSFPHKLLGTLALVSSVVLIGLVIFIDDYFLVSMFSLKIKIGLFVILLCVLGYMSLWSLCYPFSVFSLFYALMFFYVLFSL